MSEDSLPVEGNLDEQRIARAVSIGLPIVTIASAAIVGIAVGPALSILVLTAGLLLGVIALLWSSVRILSGDAALSPELEALDIDAHGVDALASRKKMLLRALKDLENEHAIGKMEADDFQQLSSTYRAELKTLLRRIDESLAPHRAMAEDLARAHLSALAFDVEGEASAPAKKRVGEHAGDATATVPAKVSAKEASVETTATAGAAARVTCPVCHESNEPDAKFCKECAGKLSGVKGKSVSATTKTEDSDEA